MGLTEKHKISDDLRQRIFERDDYTCQCCGFKSKKYQEILHINRDYTDNQPKNLATTCIFCHQCFVLDEVSIMKSGILIWLPEIPQASLNHLARALYLCRIGQSALTDTAHKIYRQIMDRRQDAELRLGTSDPAIIANVMSDFLTPTLYQKSQDKLDGLRLFPIDRRTIVEEDLEFNQFPQILAYWRSKDGPYQGQQPHQWVDLYKEIKSNRSF